MPPNPRDSQILKKTFSCVQHDDSHENQKEKTTERIPLPDPLLLDVFRCSCISNSEFHCFFLRNTSFLFPFSIFSASLFLFYSRLDLFGLTNERTKHLMRPEEVCYSHSWLHCEIWHRPPDGLPGGWWVYVRITWRLEKETIPRQGYIEERMKILSPPTLEKTTCLSKETSSHPKKAETPVDELITDMDAGTAPGSLSLSTNAANCDNKVCCGRQT